MSFKKVDVLRKSIDKEVTEDDARRTLRQITANNTAVLQAELNINEVLNEAAIIGKVEFGIKPNISALGDIFGKYTTILNPSPKNDKLLIRPAFALSLLMKTILKEIDTIDQKGYPSILTLPWDENLYLMGDKEAEDCLNVFTHTADPFIFSSVFTSDPEISCSLRDFFLHRSFSKNRITVGDIVDWALSKVVLERDLK